ncbi:MAG: ABC transporter permease [Lentisphaerae bacterium]|nr:ABC transporter permease [Lentisphaerota bacterium]
MTFLRYIADTRGELLVKTLQHLMLTGCAAGAAVLIGVPLGILIARRRALRGFVLGVSGVVQTVPSVAMLALLMIPLGLGARPAVAALVLYALLPIIVNTHAGLNGVDRNVLEAADGLGFTRRQRLWMVELPLATPVIIAGIRTSAVITVGIATLSALIGAGGLGDFIFRGLATGNRNAIALGVLAASAMALLLGYGIGFLETRLKRRLHQA